jgi:hypothetical protein
MRTVLARLSVPLLLAGALVTPATGLALPAAATAPGHLAASSAVSPAPGAYQPLNPTRVFDTRTSHHPIGPGVITRVRIQGVAGLPASGISAVTVILSVLNPAAAGSLSVFPSGTRWPGPATMSFAAASTQQNTVTAQLGGDGAVSVRNNAGSAVHLVADVVGYYAAGPAVPGGYRPVPLHRIFDTRAAGSHPLASGATASVPVTRRGAVPASNVSAGAVNLTVLSPAGTGSISVFPAGTAWDTSATVSFTAGRTEQSMLTAQLGTGGAFLVRNNTGTAVQLVIDIAGYYVAGSPPVPGGYVPIERERVFDSRVTDEYTGPFVGGELRTVPTLITSFSYRPEVPHWGWRAETILLTVVSPSQSGSISVFTGNDEFDGKFYDGKATVSFTAGRTVQRLLTVRLAPEGTIGIRNDTSVTLSVIADVEGYFAGRQNRLHLAASAVIDPNIDNDPGLYDVSCTSASFCMALDEGLAYRYDGSSWSAGVIPPGAPNWVSCVSPTFCMAVGNGVAIYDGSHWSAAGPGAPSEASAVSCASTTFCMVSAGLAYYRFNGTGWVAYPVNGFGGSSVSCPSPTFCMALAGGLLTWDGSHWTGAGGGGSVDQVSCVSSAFCQEGGWIVWEDSGATGLFIRPPEMHAPDSVSCPAAFACIAGDESDLSGWDGTEWSMPIISINPPTRREGFRLSCPTLDFCMAVYGKTAYRLTS